MSYHDFEYDQGDTFVIKEIYDHENAHEAFSDALERALNDSFRMIIIEPARLGDETARWINVGNCLHKTAVITGFASIATGLSWNDFPYTYAPLSFVSFFCTGLYTISWQFDPCVKYQVCSDLKNLASIPSFNALSSSSPIVLVKKDDTKRKILHCSITLISTVICGCNLYKLFK